MTNENEKQFSDLYEVVGNLAKTIAAIDEEMQAKIAHFDTRIKRLYGLAGKTDGRLMKLEGK